MDFNEIFIGSRQRWRGKIVRIGALIAVLMLFPLGPGSYMLYMPVHIIMNVAPEMRRLTHELDHRAIALACAQVIGNVNHFTNKRWDDPVFPDVLRNIRPNHISVNEGGIRFEMHGGFDHYRFRFAPEDSGTWGLWLYTAHSSTQLVGDIKVYKNDLQQNLGSDSENRADETIPLDG